MPVQDKPEYYVLDDVISAEECLYLYHMAQGRPKWTLNRQSRRNAVGLSPIKAFPGFNIELQGTVYDEFFSGYFRSLIFRVRKLVRERYGLKLPSDVYRIHLNAVNSQSKTDMHKDLEVEGAWTVLGFLNPVWNTADGGDFVIEGTSIDYKSARFVVFPAHLEHDAGAVVNDSLGYWRISLNAVLVHDPALA